MKKTSGFTRCLATQLTSNPAIELLCAAKKMNPNGVNKPLTWKVNMETKDFGACQP